MNQKYANKQEMIFMRQKLKEQLKVENFFRESKIYNLI